MEIGNKPGYFQEMAVTMGGSPLGSARELLDGMLFEMLPPDNAVHGF